MPVNSFENYPMGWKPDRQDLKAPLYKSIANALEKDIQNGTLSENDKLPPQRELADYLDINLSTVTRAYKICEMKGLISATIGKGTFVSSNTALPIYIIDDTESALIEMGIILPFLEHNHIIHSVGFDILSKQHAQDFFDYSHPLGSTQQRLAARKWLNRLQVDVKTENIMITSGAQNAIAIALVSLFKSGDKIVTDSYTFSNFISLANMLNIQLIPVDSDAFGMLPDKLECICGHTSIQGIYLMPSCSNPTTIVMNNERRQEIAKIIRKYRLTIIEDDIYSFLTAGDFVPFVTLLPEQTVYISGLSKPICAGIRVAYMTYPDRFRSALQSAGGFILEGDWTPTKTNLLLLTTCRGGSLIFFQDQTMTIDYSLVNLPLIPYHPSNLLLFCLPLSSA